MPLLLFIIYIAAMLRVVSVFWFVHTHTESKMPLFSEAKWPVSWEDIRDPAHIAMTEGSHTKIYEQFETLLVQDVPFCYD